MFEIPPQKSPMSTNKNIVNKKGLDLIDLLLDYLARNVDECRLEGGALGNFCPGAPMDSRITTVYSRLLYFFGFLICQRA